MYRLPKNGRDGKVRLHHRRKRETTGAGYILLKVCCEDASRTDRRQV